MKGSLQTQWCPLAGAVPCGRWTRSETHLNQGPDTALTWDGASGTILTVSYLHPQHILPTGSCVGSKEVLLNPGGQSTCWEHTQLRQWAPVSNAYYTHFRVPHFTNKTHFRQSECRQNFCCCREIDRGRMCRRQNCGSFWHNTTQLVLSTACLLANPSGSKSPTACACHPDYHVNNSHSSSDIV